jgi:DNA anti-recombination protein RmuC
MTGPELALTVLLVAAAAALFFFALRRSQPKELATLIQQAGDLAALRQQLETMARVQETTGEMVRSLETRLVETGAALKTDLTRELAKAHLAMEKIRSAEEQRQRREAELKLAITRIESVLSGAGRRGEAGEQILQAALKELPAGMVEYGFRVNGKEVEFALVLPDGRRLAVDSKWTASELLRRLVELSPGSEYDSAVEEIERNLERRVREVTQYIAPPNTLPWAVAAVPDAAYAVARRVHAEAFRQGVILIPYSQAIPYLLTLYQLHLRYSAAVDAERVTEALTQLERQLGEIERTLENSVARSITTLQNAYGTLRTSLGEIRGVLAGMHRQSSGGTPSQSVN